MHPSIRRSAAAVATTVLVATACSIPMDAAPRIPDEASTTTAPVTTTTSVGDTTATLYFTRGNEIVVVTHDLDSTSPEAVVTAIAAGPTPRESSLGLVSQLPPGLEVIEATVDNRVLSLDLSSEFDNIVGLSKAQAAAQIVFSVTELPDIDEVIFYVDGVLSQITSPVSGDTARVSACDFVSSLANEDTLAAVTDDSELLAAVSARRLALTDRCPTSGG